MISNVKVNHIFVIIFGAQNVNKLNSPSAYGPLQLDHVVCLKRGGGVVVRPVVRSVIQLTVSLTHSLYPC